MIDDVHLSIEKSDFKLSSSVTKRTGVSSAAASFISFFFKFLCVVSLVATYVDQSHFHSQLGMSPFDVIVPIRFKSKHYAVYIERGSKILFFFVEQQNIVNYWDFPSKILKNCPKRLVQKVIQHDQRKCLKRFVLAPDWYLFQ